MIDILLADNQPLTRAGTIALLSAAPDLTIISSADNRNDLEQKLDTLKPQVLIIDHHFGDKFDIDFITSASAHYPDTRILVLSDNQQREEILALTDQGINYISKRCSRTEIIEGVRATAKGKAYLCKSIQEVLQPNTDAIDIPQLSSREAEIVQLIADGLTNKDIAERLYISVHTIKTHRKNIIKKLGFSFKNAAELASFIQSM